MGKRLVFLLHGMGTHPVGWEAPFVQAIHEAYGLYPFLSGTPIEDSIEFVPLRYDDVFQDIVSTWATNAALLQAATVEVPGGLSKLTSWLSGAGELNNNFGWTHAADVLLYRAFRLVRERVCVHVAAQITQRITQQVDATGSCSWSAIAHSLGTAVLHDTLARLWQPPADGPPAALAFNAQNAQADLVMMVANVSRVLESKSANEPYDVFSTAVKPGFPGQAGRGCKSYLNIRHRLDPFTIPKMFSPQLWPDEAALAAKPPRYQSVEVDHIHQLDVHDFVHYLKNPAAHVPMLRRLLGPQVVSDAEFQQAQDKFRLFGPLQDAAAVALKQKLESMLPSQADDWLSIGKLWKKLYL